VVFIGVLDRYALKTGQAWPDELSRYLLIWVSFLAAAVSAQRLGHYTVAVLADWLVGSGRARRYFAAAVSFGSAGLFALLIPGTLYLVDVGSRQASPVLGVPMWLIFSSSLIGAGALTFFFLAAGLEALTAAKPVVTSTPRLEV
ncbi:MAG: TRAP transporter small permease subunit, partial [Actinobacteria bacterium]|nr:TRAP transporter small permease subunit [Actinomycetota bacterium]